MKLWKLNVNAGFIRIGRDIDVRRRNAALYVLAQDPGDARFFCRVYDVHVDLLLQPRGAYLLVSPAG